MDIFSWCSESTADPGPLRPTALRSLPALVWCCDLPEVVVECFLQTEVKMPQIDMVLIPEPEPDTRAVFVFDPTMTGPLMRGNGSVTFRCGRCKRVLLENVGLEQIQNIVFKCPKCS